MQEVLDVWNTPGMVYAQGGTIASTSFRDNGEPLVNGDCMMHRQASFFSSFFPDGTPVQDGLEGAIDVFGSRSATPILRSCSPRALWSARSTSVPRSWP